MPVYFSSVYPVGSGLQGVSAKGLFHEATSPVMTGENTSQNGNNDWSLFHNTSEKRPVTGKLQQSDRQILISVCFTKTFSCVTVTCHCIAPFDHGSE